MNRQEFMKQLEMLLSDISQAEREKHYNIIMITLMTQV